MSIPGHSLSMSGGWSYQTQPKIFCQVSKEPITITETTPSTVYKNRMYYFKNEEMKTIFLKEPEKYLNDQPTGKTQTGYYLLLGGLVGLGMIAMMLAFAR